MFVAYNKNKMKVHISNTNKNEKYYCLTCGEELCLKKGNIKVHHFSHKTKTNCDNWHYDMSEWHSSWQNQFPLENQEVVFELNNKKHRADVFINNTVIEFQHSPIDYSEFNDRNVFYNNLGYKVIWIFDATESFENKEIKELVSTKNEYYWEKQFKVFRELASLNSNVDIYLQEYKNIWSSHPDYKEISIANDEIEEYAYLHHIDWINGKDGLEYFVSLEKNNLFDYEFIDRYVNVKFLHDGSFDVKLDMIKRYFALNDISDSINSYYDFMSGNYQYIWCAAIKKFVYSGDACHACNHLSVNGDRCKYRFENLLSKQFDKIINIEYSENDKVEYITILRDKKRYKIRYETIPKPIFTLKEAFELLPNTNVIRAKNINSNWNVQLTRYNYNRMIKYGKCFGKIQAPDRKYYSFTKSEVEIFNWNKKEWKLLWRK